MSSVTTWRTKDHVHETLKKLSGGSENPNNVYILKGDEPPPVMHEAEDEEMRLQFGDAIHAANDVITDNPAPDLQGITDLLRLLKASDGDDSNEEVTTIREPSNCVIAISKGSKLNPNVEEFKPKSGSSHHSSSDISDNSLKSVENASTDRQTDIARDDKVSENVAEDLATKLKNEISEASKSNSFEGKKRKNAAIASLLALYETETKTPPPKPVETLKLITPDYFENRTSPINVQSEPNASLPSTSTSPDPKSLNSETLTNSSNAVKSEPALSTKPTEEIKKPVADPAVNTSTEKVNQWFSKQQDQAQPSVQRNSPTVFLGPFTYKKKNPPASKTPITSNLDENKVMKVSQANEYIPTNYAADLKQKYMERNKSKEVGQMRNTWTDLHVILKEKEMLTKKNRGK